ncbi:MAG TPA: tripartite tricarboxylate transporter substrate binding protein [Xanthobacteraceae bacterium]|nr:tripartite tricarboxylate transporter substrate binding protein [Xanthobacteraceae bacterium]
MTMLRRQFLWLAGSALAAPTAAPTAAWAQRYPARPIQFIVPLAAGGGLDFIARLIAGLAAPALGQQVVVENRTGAGGTIGIEAAAKSAPDGYTVLVSNDNIASAPHILKVNGDYAKDLVPVSLIARQPLVIGTHPSLDVHSLGDLVALAKQKPGLAFASSGVGTNQHILGEWLNKTAGIKLDHIPYRGAGQAVGDLLAGHVTIGILGPTALMPHAKAGALRILAQSGHARSPSLPDVPTFEEAGFKGLVLETWYGAFVPAGTPAAVIARLNAELDKAVASPAAREKMLQSASEPVGGAPEQLATQFQGDFAKYGRLVKELNIRIG